MKKRILALLLTALVLAGCQGKPTENAENPIILPTEANYAEENLEKIRSLGMVPQDEYRTFYEIFVYSFCDSDGDGIGDLQGVISKLDYLQELGITGIWLMPIHPSPSYHKYDVLDYDTIDPAYGTMEDFEQLLAETESRGIKVIMDLVLNHTSVEHPWFLKAADYLSGLQSGDSIDPSACPEAEYYHFIREDNCPAGYHPVPGAEEYCYEGRFSPQMPDVNFSCEALKQQQEEIMAFWLKKGVDGFRLDAAKEFYTGDMEKNLEVLESITAAAQKIKPDCYLVAEVWDSFMTISQYYESGFQSFFNFPFGASDGKIMKVVRGAGNGPLVSSFAEAQEKADTAFRKGNPHYLDAPFLSNHDVGRIGGFAARNPEKTKLAGAMNLFMGGNAFIYYGEEIGMVAGAVDDPSFRAPMYWNKERTQGVTQPPPGCKLPEEYPFGSLEEQKEDPDSLYNYYRQAIAIRNAIPAIARGIPKAEKPLNQNSVSACRKVYQDKSAIVLMNISQEEKTIDLTGYEAFSLAAVLSVSEETIILEENTLILPAFGIAVLQEG